LAPGCFEGDGSGEGAAEKTGGSANAGGVVRSSAAAGQSVGVECALPLAGWSKPNGHCGGGGTAVGDALLGNGHLGSSDIVLVASRCNASNEVQKARRQYARARRDSRFSRNRKSTSKRTKRRFAVSICQDVKTSLAASVFSPNIYETVCL
jgi:hypothetical protein